MRKASPGEIIEHRRNGWRGLVPSHSPVNIEMPVPIVFPVARQSEILRNIQPPATFRNIGQALKIDLGNLPALVVCNFGMRRMIFR